MSSERPQSAERAKFIGCATDRKFVEPTAVMLTSLDLNGEVADATVLVAAFNLTAADHARLRLGAGRLAERLRIVEVTRDMFHEVDPTGFTDQYPPAILGRLMLADHIEPPNARLLTIDSDMIVNASLKPLFRLDLGAHYFAAVHDPPRQDDPRYFNSGLTLCDVDAYKRHDVGRRALRYIAEYRPPLPDQDALNDVVGDAWYNLDPLWNYFMRLDRDFTPQDYELAKIAHFPKWKPWDYSHHPGVTLYGQYLAEYRARLQRWEALGSQDAADVIVTAYEVLLGRELESDSVLQERGHWSSGEIVKAIVQSEEFRHGVLRSLETRERLPAGLFAGAPSRRQRLWAARQLGVGRETAHALQAVRTWRELLTLVLADPDFTRAMQLEPLDLRPSQAVHG